MKATVTSKGQITIPKYIRTQARIDVGTEIDFQIHKNGTIVLIPITLDSAVQDDKAM